MSRYERMDYIAVELARMYSERHGEPFFVAVGNFRGYDLRSLSGTVKVELKLETTPTRTGNVCVEYWNADYDAASGILGTEANIWLHLIPAEEGYEAFEYDIDRLRKLVIEEGQIRSNGRNSLFALIPVDVFRKNAQRVFTFHSRFCDANN